MQFAIEAHSLVKKYDSIAALDDITLVVNRGEIFGFLGPNGAGKSTFVKIILNLVRATSGGVRIFGEPVTNVKARKTIGFLPENIRVYPFLKIEEFLRFHCELIGIASQNIKMAIDTCLCAMELESVRAQKIGTLSKGMLQRTGIAQAMLGNPELLIFDEPTSGLDPIGFTELRRLLLAMKARGTTIFLNSHQLSEVERTCDRVAILNKGRIIKIGSRDDLSDRGKHLEVTAEGFTDGMAAAINAFSQKNIETEGNKLRIYLSNEKDSVNVHSIIVEAGGRVQSLAWKSESLEELFYRLVKNEDMGFNKNRP
jgi:ABC-2 type transport system ATP-binding protein